MVLDVTGQWLREYGKDTLTFVDLEMAYDSIIIQEIWKALHTASVSRGQMERIKNIYDKYENSVVMESNKSETFQMFREVRWGSVISPMLFMIMNEMIGREG
jgi:hypothetical protein